MAKPAATAVGTPLSSAWIACLANPTTGLVILGCGDLSKGQIPTTAGTFSPGCIMMDNAGTSTTTNLWANSGTAASVTWTSLTIS